MTLDHHLETQRQYWDRAFAQPRRSSSGLDTEHWLDILTQKTAISLRGKALELGCGRGHDTTYLLRSGCRVVSLDLSLQALKQIVSLSPGLGLVQGALPYPLPFKSRAFDVVVAGLSLHYFLWEETLAIVADIRRLLQPDGLLIFQVNSTDDVAHGFGQGEEVEPNLFLRQGRYKRFFSQESCHTLFQQGWRLELLLPHIETRFEQAKHTWVGVSRPQA